ncbi:peptidoglycan-binding domain-containing protein [Nioella sp.]|uniref:peptidoglycan-binding domain-containing protein n=1 Tax=Nioella sp. TaxID=1912091 RepID=UPI003B526354
MKPTLPLTLGLLVLAACGPMPGAEVARLLERDGTIVTRGEGPEDARPDACYAQDVTPAVIETVTEQVIVQPPEIATDGTVRAPAIFRTDTRQRIVQERQEIWFETPCEAQSDPDFIATLQRALAARGHYHGPVTGVMDRRTERAIREFQEPQGLDSGVLSLAGARLLGLAVWDPVAAERPES